MFEFIADRRALDFVATVSERRTAQQEQLRTPADLVAWVRASGLVDDQVTVDGARLRDARQLRESMFGLVSALIDGAAPDPADLQAVNAAAARPRPVLDLEPDGTLRRRGDLDAVLAELATDALDLAGSPDRRALHWCADTTCTRPFVDRSRGQRRRWCGMKGCGDRAKAAAYRQRRASIAPA
ncbi:CGNR zinc finger domain-containing protein [uncultured Friedmanniella sp.]|uniref:CGNR zinc finger domain-containing protein n=1 Tax=uncultured Friedmanniella sp. TaxID=335381 RepID=UPI0035CBA97C